MEQELLGALWPVSKLTISAAGLAAIWGKTPEEEGIATLYAALDAGINHIDVAPSYGRGRAEQLLGKAMEAGWPEHVRVTTKVRVGNIAPLDVLPRLRASLQRSLSTMGRQQVDLLVLHSQIVPDGWQCARHRETQDKTTIPLTLYQQAVVPALRALVAEGLCANWGITAIGPNASVRSALQDCEPGDRPAAAQCIVNALESAGALDYTDPTQNAAATRQAAAEAQVGVLGIRLVQAGALTDKMDREPRGSDERDFDDYQRAQGLREIAADAGIPMAVMAYRYGLADTRVHSLILGIKNRTELTDALQALADGPLPTELLDKINRYRDALPVLAG